jgi:HAMP domain-containing protein
MTSDYYQADEQWWIEGRELGVYIGNVVFDDSSGIYSTTIAIRIDDEEDNFVGMLKAVWNIQEIFDLLDSSQFFAGQDIYESQSTHLLDGNGRLLYSTDTFQFLENKSRWLSLFQKNNEISYCILTNDNYQENEKLVAYDYSSVLDQYAHHDWILAIDFDTADIFSPVYNLRDMIVISIIVILLIGLAISYMLSRMISKPIIKLRDITKEISKGDFNANISINSNDEIGELSQSFQKMMVEIKKSRIQLEEYNKNLEQTVQDRTAQLALSKKEIEKLSRLHFY